MSMIEKYGLTADVALIATMFAAYFSGFPAVAHAAIALFTGIGLVQVAKIRMESA